MFNIVIITTNHKALSSLSTPRHGGPRIFDVAPSKRRVGRLIQCHTDAAVGLCIHVWFHWGDQSLSWRAGSPTCLPVQTPKPKWVEYTPHSHPGPHSSQLYRPFPASVFRSAKLWE